MKRKCITRIVAILLSFSIVTIPVFGMSEEGLDNQGNPNKEVTEVELDEASSDENTPEVKPAPFNADDPEFQKYYYIDENGEAVRKSNNTAANSRAVKATFEHPDRYKNHSIYNCIDVSEFQGTIDWNKVRSQGITHAIIRVGYRGQTTGGLYKDSRYIENINGAYAAGIKVGVYFYSQALSEAEASAEASYIISAIAPYKSKISMQVVMDYEFGLPKEAGGRFYAGCISNTQMTNNCIAFATRVQSNNYEPMIYANASMLVKYLNRNLLQSKYKIWLAHYTTKTDYAGSIYIWQYTSTGRVNGIAGNVDLDFIYDPIVVPDKVGGFKVTETETNSISLEWLKTRNADGYNIYRASSPTGSYKKIETVPGNESVSWIDKNIGPGTYYYKINAYKNNDGAYYYSGYSGPIYGKTKSVYPGTPKSLRQYQSGADRVVMAWTPTDSVDGYIIYRAKSSRSSFSKVAQITNNKQGSWADYNVSASSGYWYRIRSYKKINGSYYYSSMANTAYAKTTSKNPGRVSYIRLYKKTNNSYIITWGSASNADGYVVYKATSQNGTYRKADTVPGRKSSWADYDLKKGQTCYYKVIGYKAYKGSYYYGSSPIYRLRAS